MWLWGRVRRPRARHRLGAAANLLVPDLVAVTPPPGGQRFEQRCALNRASHPCVLVAGGQPSRRARSLPRHGAGLAARGLVRGVGLEDVALPEGLRRPAGRPDPRRHDASPETCRHRRNALLHVANCARLLRRPPRDGMAPSGQDLQPLRARRTLAGPARKHDRRTHPRGPRLLPTRAATSRLPSGRLSREAIGALERLPVL